MKRTLMTTAALFFTAQMAMAAIDPQSLADRYLAEGYTSVEVKQGPTQTKLEAVKGATMVEVVYSNDTGKIISKETQSADAEEQGRSGVEIQSTSEDFADVNDDDGEDQPGDDDQAGDDGDDDQAGDDSDDDHEGGDDHEGDDDHDGGDDDGDDDHDGGDDDGEGDDGDNSGGNDSSGSDCGE